MKRTVALCVGFLLGIVGCKALPKQDSATLAILFGLERKLEGAAMKLIRPGVVYARWIGPGPVFLQIVAIDLNRRDLYFRPILGSDRMDGSPDTWESVDEMARRTGALAAISGDYPEGGLNISGFTVLDGAVHLAPKPPKRSGIVIGRGNKVRFEMYDPDRIGSPGYYQAIGGGPILLKEGVFSWEWSEGKINGERAPYAATIFETPQARTVACLLDNNRTFYWIHVENRHADRSGIKPQDLKKLLRQLKCREAIMLIGGKYSALSLKGRLLGSSRGKGTPIGSALGLYERKGP